jgi:hypothetical protein
MWTKPTIRLITSFGDYGTPYEWPTSSTRPFLLGNHFTGSLSVTRK